MEMPTVHGTLFLCGRKNMVRYIIMLLSVPFRPHLEYVAASQEAHITNGFSLKGAREMISR